MSNHRLHTHTHTYVLINIQYPTQFFPIHSENVHGTTFTAYRIFTQMFIEIQVLSCLHT